MYRQSPINGLWLVLGFTLAGFAFVVFLFAGQGKVEKLRATLKGGYPVCRDRSDLPLIIDFFIIQGRNKTTTGLGPCMLAASQSFTLVEDQGDVVRISLFLPNVRRTQDLWTYRVNISNEETPQNKFLELLRSSLADGKGSKEGFIKPETGQLEDCPLIRSSVREPFHPNYACEKEVQAKGFIRADKYQAKFLKR